MENYFVFQLETKILSLKGKDIFDFLNRITTNEIKQNNFQITKTFFLNDKGKILEFSHCINLNTKLLLTYNNEKIINHIEKYIVFDDIKIELQNTFVYLVCGIDALSVLKKKIKINFEKNFFHNKNIIIFPETDFKTPTYIVISNNKIDFPILPFSEFDELRIDNNFPNFQNEISQNINPLELGFKKYISFTKGCYLGQEIIARIDTYKKLQKKFVKFCIESFNEKKFDTTIFTNNNTEVGNITSLYHSNSKNKFIGLGFLDTKIDEKIFVKNLTGKLCEVKFLEIVR